MVRILDLAVQVEKDTKRYQNRTWNAFYSVVADEFTQSHNFAEMDLSFQVDYADLLVKRGYSDFDDIAKRAINLMNLELRTLV